MAISYGGAELKTPLVGFNAEEGDGSKSLPDGAKMTKFSFWHSTVWIENANQATKVDFVDGEKMLTFETEGFVYVLPEQHHRVHMIEIEYEHQGKSQRIQMGNKEPQDSVTSYSFNDESVFLGLVQMYRQFEFTIQGIGITRIKKVNIAAFFGVIILDTNCWCPQAPQGFGVTIDEVSGQSRSVTLNWLPYSKSAEYVAPTEYRLTHSKN
jgi:hypothetical protein